MEKHNFVEKRWKRIIFIGKNDGKSSFLMEKQWKTIIFNGKTVENHHFQWNNYRNHHC